MSEKRLVVVTPVEWHHAGDAPKFLVWDDGSWPCGDDLDRIVEAVNERDELRGEVAALREAADAYLFEVDVDPTDATGSVAQTRDALRALLYVYAKALVEGK